MTTLPGAAAVIATTVLVALGVLQVLLVGGRPVGALAWGGTHTVLPTRLRIASAGTVVLYAAFAVALLLRADVISGAHDHFLVTVGTWCAAAVFALGILANAASRSRTERRWMTPASVVLTAAALLVALWG